MKCNCYDWREDPTARMFVAGVVTSALAGDEYLVFTIWIPGMKTKWQEGMNR